MAPYDRPERGILSRDVTMLAAQVDTLLSVLAEYERVREARGSARIATPRWLLALAVLAVDVEFLGSRRDHVDFAAVGDVCQEVERLLSHESKDEEVRLGFLRACRSCALAQSLAAEARDRSHHLGDLARLLQRPEPPAATAEVAQ